MKKILFLALAAVTLALGACSNDEDLGLVESGKYITVDASIGTMTRVATTGNTATFEKDDQISVFAWTGNANEVPAYRVVDGSVNTFNGTTWTASPQMLWADMESAHYFLAVYPAHTITDFKADLYTLDVASQMKSDLLIAVNNAGLKAQNNPVQLTFDHAMAKLVVNLHFRDQWATTPTVESVKLEGYTNATVDYLTKTVAGKGKGDVYLPALTSAPTGYEKSYSSIVIPSTDTKTIRISIGDKDYVYNHATNIPLESGKYTTINLNVGRNTITLANVSISKWEKQGDDIEGEAEEVIQYTTSETGGITTYTVYTATGLQAVNKLITSDNSLLNSNITLAADIDLTNAPKDANESNWTPIGSSDIGMNYTGTFDGGGHTIRGLVINSDSDYQGLIGYLSKGGTVKNLTLKGCTIKGKNFTGGIVGYCENSTIENVTLEDCTVTGYEYVGGIAGYCNSTIENCTVRATSGKDVRIKGNMNIGGIVGDNWNGGKIIACKVVAEGGTITLTQEGTYTTKRIGGIAGNNFNSSLTACLAKGVNLVSTNTDCVIGGIAGKNGQNSSLTGCYAYGCMKNGVALDNDKNIVGDKTSNNNTVTACYYTANGSTFGHVGGSDASDWTAVMSVMNSDLITVGYLWQWSGSADNPTLTKK